MFDLRTCESIHAFARAVADDWRWQASYDKRSGAVTLYHYKYGIGVRHDLSVVSHPFRTDSRARDVLFAMTGVRVDLVQRADWSEYPVKKSNLRDTGYFVELDNGDRYRAGGGHRFDLSRVGDKYTVADHSPWHYAVLDRDTTNERRRREEALLAAVEALVAALGTPTERTYVSSWNVDSPIWNSAVTYVSSGGDEPPTGELVTAVYNSNLCEGHSLWQALHSPKYKIELYETMRKTK